MGSQTHRDVDHSDVQARSRSGHRRATAAIAVGALVATLAAGFVTSTDPTAANRGWDAGRSWQFADLS